MALPNVSSQQQGNIASIFSIYFRFKLRTSSYKYKKIRHPSPQEGGMSVEVNVLYLLTIMVWVFILSARFLSSYMESVPRFLGHSVLTRS